MEDETKVETPNVSEETTTTSEPAVEAQTELNQDGTVQEVRPEEVKAE